jgi:predicted nuclease of predicted toxin-antitoxin system
VTVREVLDPRATDPDIAAYAAEHGYVVFTSDDDFFALDVNCGRIHYSQEETPDAGDVLTAVSVIADAYDEHTEIVEHVPDGWV